MVIVQDENGWLYGEHPVTVVAAYRPEEVAGALQAIETAVNKQHLTAVGFIAYEAAAAFGFAVHTPPSDLPLLWFGLYDQPRIEPHPPVENGVYTSGNYQPAISRAAYTGAIGQIKAQIAAANTYQVNYTFPLQAPFTGDAKALFLQLAQNQAAKYMAYLDNGRFQIASASPELFFKLEGETLTSKPMKGTVGRGRTAAEDRANAEWLAVSIKNRAENVMIVDMIRNDMGQIAETGSVAVPHLFEIERYPTVLQMTSTVTAQTNASIAEIIAAMFPCASITGAPKKQTMEIIRELEPQPRGVYTGAIGFIAPGRRARFNVAIRTAVIDRQTERATYGVGGGIVWDSEAEAEYAECKVKARVLERKRPSFQLLESLLWEPEKGYFLLDYHLERLLESAFYFAVQAEETAVRRRLAQTAAELQTASKVRLLIEPSSGEIRIEHAPIAPLPDPARVAFALQPVDSNNRWLYHKTTHRAPYARAARPAVDETILWNERGEITEGCSANIVVEMDGGLYTPPIESGLLAGTFRRRLLENGRISERIIKKEELTGETAVYLINSVRRWRKTILHIESIAKEEG